MSYEFIKLSEVPVTEFDADTGLQNVIIEEEGEIKRIPLYTLTSSSTNNGIGGYKYYYLYSGYLYETTSAYSPPQSTALTNTVKQHEFDNAYHDSPVMINFGGEYITPLLSWYQTSGGGHRLVHIDDVGDLTEKVLYFNTSN